MSKTYIVIVLYILGMLVFAYESISNERNIVKFRKLMKECGLNQSRMCLLTTIAAILFSVTWPICLVYDPIIMLKNAIKRRS